MKNINLYFTITFIVLTTLVSCNSGSQKEEHQHDAKGNHTTISQKPEGTPSEESHEEGLHLTQEQVEALNIKVDTISKRNMSGFIQVNGLLGVPPQNEAVVTTTIGANIRDIKVIEGDQVSKGKILAYISHPDIITMQTDYLQTYNKLTFLEQDYNRQKKLYDAQVGSGRDYQKAKSAFSSIKGLAKGYESQLRLLGLSPENVRGGNISQIAYVRSPIDGFVEKVQVKSGQYVQPQTTMFEIVNTEHIHADLMVFEKDVSKVKNGQLVKFNIEALGNQEMTANIYSVGKSFEEDPKALHVHAEIENKNENLIPGMYVNARIITEDKPEKALPDDAIFQEGETSYVFIAERKDSNIWGFTPQEIIVTSSSNGFKAFSFKNSIQKNALIAQSGAYYLMAEMKKSEAEHSH
ncbi:efflux RND transporter periplasmic adaptor subunit [Aquimarina sp. 2201CG5-10]|uniref:efflux RND transporter periplasmic adaptor subunit n=1 Tax=Aquimarina callyspongiae TaxID=3098150 RepID=UPI002AB4CBF3|nr:efflux RND transporter periplasmic adaptor subunit [Aquimarina sp. 2201CG5-10]MDY8134620.1 efflux RND transporter periplasmic adaptor subunit [Aquimarina sp. 2201CG5-10]